MTSSHRPLDPAWVKRVLEVLTALQTEVAVEIFYVLRNNTEMTTPSRIALDLDTSVQTVSYHLMKMYRSRLVNRVQMGRHVFYSPRLDAIKILKDLAQ